MKGGNFMARIGREKSKMDIYHVLLRGMNVLFKNDDDFVEFTNILRRYAASGGIEIYSYSLLKNRVHLAVKAENIGLALKPICTSYARYFNRTHISSGKIFYDRFKSEPINSKKELADVVAFINNISKKAGDDYPFSSLDKSASEFCNVSGELTKKEFVATEFSNMYIEDFDCLSQKELTGYIFDLTGVNAKDFKFLSKAEFDEKIEILTEKHWISGTKIFELLGIKKAAKKTTQKPVKKVSPVPKNAPKPEPKPEPKKELSVWLL